MIRSILTTLFGSILLALSPALAATNTPDQDDATSESAEIRGPVTILISIDGFRPDYMDRGITPNLAALATAGVHAPMRPSFPTKTFPNHWTLVTGKTPDNHGIVGNTMEDTARPGEVFKMATKDPFWWDQAEPIWITAEKQGVRSATMFWPGSEVELDGKRPGDWWPFNEKLSNDRRVNAIIDWMRRPAQIRPKLITLYFDTVDSAGHYFGPAPSDRLDAAIKAVDQNIGDLKAQLDVLGQPVNFVIVSDHGMAETAPERIIYLDTIMPRDQYRLVEDGNYAGIESLTGDMDAIRAAFLKTHDNMQCWERSQIPEHFRYGQNARVPSIICLPETGWVVYQDVPEWMTGIGGGHGYDNRHPDMTAFFLASGPAIAAKGKMPIFDNVDVYSLVARLANIEPNASDGNLHPFEDALAK
ncbi:ectonucleotide pyrophosphatase/phosphodiesterase [Parasphingorhabdus halotolerans]|uniref:Alkaline phosphatase family protein n=1 Tax=Parasphingorhabdus halotolerans TaxID=2725558 RepID=A0A6H2DKD2_9SPHN|nr:ectonucleotide pyrophosphatase/phosphodiesterase [Parasphingorhabdus halotolerans]QJB68405.1 alkaline phosphatase family protein [Parasphingorhabdus halotolerans]